MTKLFEEGLPASPTEAEAKLSEKDRLVAAIQHELMTLKSELERARDQPATQPKHWLPDFVNRRPRSETYQSNACGSAFRWTAM